MVNSIAGRMTTRKSIEWFEVGVRTSQSILLWPESDAHSVPATDTARFASLNRLSRAARQLESCLASTNLQMQLDRLSRIYSGSANSEAIHTGLLDIKSELDWYCRSREVETNRLAWELGGNVADGIDEVWSDGVPAVSNDNRVPPARIEISFSGAKSPSWQWQNEPRVRQLARSLELNLERFIPVRPPSDSNPDLLPGVSFRRWWGWFSIESALMVLKDVGSSLPRWNAETRTLFVGETVVRHYIRNAPKQIAVLEAFALEGWPNQIPNPLTSPNDQNKTIRDLNKDIFPALIRFRGAGNTDICWELTGDAHR